MFDNTAFRRQLLGSFDRAFAESAEDDPAYSLTAELDRLADHLEKHLDLDRIEGLLGLADLQEDAWTG